MNINFVPPMTRKYNTAPSVHAKLPNLEDLSLQLGNHNDNLNMGWRQISQQISLLGEYSFIHVYS